MESKVSFDQASTTSFERRAYIDGVSYLIKGLPGDLDETELVVLRKAMSAPILGPGPSARKSRQIASARDARRRPMIHRAMQALVAQAIVFFCAVWPYMLFMLECIRRLERKYNWGRSLVALNVYLAKECVRHCKNFAVAFSDIAVRNFGQSVTRTFSQTLQSIAGGISDGVAEGCARAEDR